MIRLHGTFLVAVLAAGLIAVPAATAALTDEVRAGGAEAGAATEAATEALPSLPIPVEPPPVPKVPPPTPPPPVSSPPPPTPPSAPIPDPSAADPGGSAGEVGSPPRSAAEGASTSPGPISSSEPGAGAVAGKPGQRSIGQAETPSLRRWRAYVWPAIALRIEDAMAPLLTRLDGIVEVGVLPDAVETFIPSALSDSVGLAGPPVRVESPRGEPRPSSGPSLPGEEMGLLATLLVALLTAMGLVALARLVVGEDLFEGRHWPGHRG